MFQNLNVNMSEICQLVSFWQNYDTFTFLILTVFWPIYGLRHFFDTFPNLFRHFSDRVWHLTEYWQISDTFLTVFWQYFETDSFLTVFRQISDRFLKFKGPTLSKSTNISSLNCEALFALELAAVLVRRRPSPGGRFNSIKKWDQKKARKRDRKSIC